MKLPARVVEVRYYERGNVGLEGLVNGVQIRNFGLSMKSNTAWRTTTHYDTKIRMLNFGIHRHRSTPADEAFNSQTSLASCCANLVRAESIAEQARLGTSLPPCEVYTTKVYQFSEDETAGQAEGPHCGYVVCGRDLLCSGASSYQVLQHGNAGRISSAHCPSLASSIHDRLLCVLPASSVTPAFEAPCCHVVELDS